MSSGESPSVSRRKLLGAVGAAGVGTAALALGGSAEAAERLHFHDEVDVVVCGGGPGGMAAALFARWRGNDSLILEKSGVVGGTGAKAAFWYWIPNNKPMRDKGMADPKDDFLRLVARMTAPETYDASAPRYGLDAWRFAMFEAFYESASPAAELLAEKGALPYRHLEAVPDYWAELPENKAPYGRGLIPKDANAYLSDGGQVATRTLSTAARRDGVHIRTSHRLERILQDSTGRVIGVEARNAGGDIYRVRARKGVILATGGFTHDAELRSNFLSAPVFGGCAALSNEGDAIRATSRLGVQLRNMKNAWLAPLPLERALAKDGSLSCVFAMTGDSMVIVNKYGQRVANEKQPYNELARSFSTWDGERAEYKNLVQVAIWDQRAQDKCAMPFFGSLIVPDGAKAHHVITGADLQELAAHIGERLASVHSQTGVVLANDFVTQLQATIERFNGFAKSGKDLDFARGERAIEKFVGGAPKEPGQTNATMWPISSSGPYYAALIGAGTLDTKGGPKIDVDGRVLDEQDHPIPGLYGVGNCVAAASGGAYWGGGSTIGPILTFAYRAAQAIGDRTGKAKA